MSDKRTEVICTKVDERLALDLLHEAAKDDRSVSEFIYLLLRKEIYGRQGKPAADAGQST